LSTNDDNQQGYGQDLNISAIVTTGVAFVLICIVVVMYLYGLYLRTIHLEEERKAVGQADELFGVKQGQLEELATSGWVDPEAGIARIPIGEAIRDTAEAYSSGQAASEGNGNVAGAGSNSAELGGEDIQPVAGGDGAAAAGRPQE
jgi:hypothetical protein